MNRRHARHALTAAVLVCVPWGLVACTSSSPEDDRDPSADTPACELFRPVAVDLGLGDPSASSISPHGCTAYEEEYGTFTLTLDDRPLAAAAAGAGRRTEMEINGREAVMLMGAMDGVCKIFLPVDERSSVELRLGRTTAMTPQVCTSLEEAAEKVAARLAARD
ncbi:hypothetical protein FNQ90_00160 [Streptomyces alkaliphilus]|uniref:DUF3558 domain-containing protein n=1 Tax=Streptomyces alkaliphilus TaxID=1472722 RepID=A0A7W3T986_9ACTN|nr:hypothetical protein [Streptomyces alkaliphilus]MBB0242557.1 hypothetical protein [Streptomyces alkaliphilus]